MTVNIEKIANAAGIALNDKEKVLFAKQVQGIIEVLGQLQTVDTSSVEPLMSVSQHNLRLREDIAINPRSEENVMKSANNSRYGYFVTPKFVD